MNDNTERPEKDTEGFHAVRMDDPENNI